MPLGVRVHVEQVSSCSVWCVRDSGRFMGMQVSRELDPAIEVFCEPAPVPVPVPVPVGVLFAPEGRNNPTLLQEEKR